MSATENKETALSTLLADAFDGNAAGLHQWIRLSLGKEIHDELPSDSSKLSQLVFEVTLAIQRHGRADTALFESLHQARPGLNSRINEVAKLYGVSRYSSLQVGEKFTDRPAAPPATTVPVPSRKPAGHRAFQVLGVATAATLLAIASVVIALMIYHRVSIEAPVPAHPIVDPPKGDAAPRVDELATQTPTASDGAGSPAPGASEPLIVDLTVWRKTADGRQALAPGARLRTGDLIAFEVNVSKSSYVYIAQEAGDSHDVIRVSEGPVRRAQFPMPTDRANYYVLRDDGTFGMIAVNVIASRERLSDLEDALDNVTAQQGTIVISGKKLKAALDDIAPQAPDGSRPRGHFELPSHRSLPGVSVRYRQRPGDLIVVASFSFNHVE